MFTIKVKTEFSAAHALRDYPGDCARVHGHNWKVQAEIQTKQLNAIGIGIDFKDVKKAMGEIIGILDHQYINEIPPFDSINPTAENVVQWIFEQMDQQISDQNTRLVAMTIWETDRSSVTYTKS